MSNNPVAIADDLVARLRAGIAQSRASTPLTSGKPFLRLLKSGEWVFGVNSADVQQGSSWAVNPLSIRHGWVCWNNSPEATKAEQLGEVMAPVHEPKPEKPEPVRGNQYVEQRAFELKCMDGDDAGLEVQSKLNSLGGMKATDTLLAALQEQLGKDSLHPCPVVTLESDWYTHAKYGRIYFPILTIVDWASMDGQLASLKQLPTQDATQAPTQTTQAPPAKPTKAPLKPDLRVAPAPTEPAPTAANRTPGTPRRRPTAA